MTLVKICGITNLEDALATIDAGADALGFNFYSPSPRYISPAAARVIVDQLPKEILTVGVFVNELAETVKQIANEVALGAVQLHGEEPVNYCTALSELFVIKVFRVNRTFKRDDVTRYEVPAIMLDAFDATVRGGTGQVIDWELAREVNRVAPRLFLAGGLSPENVGMAVKEVRPYAVDACSALEQLPGKKDINRVNAFVRAVRSIT